MLNSRICEMLDIEYPVFQGGMAWIADGVLAAAVSQGGGLGIIAAGNARGEDVRKEIRIAKEKTHRPIGVNIMLLSPYADEVAKVVLEENVAVVTTGAGNPSKYMESWKEAGIKVIPVVASVALAKRMAKYGASALIAEGGESGGHVGELTTMALVPQIADATDLPVIAAGGIADGRGFAAALMLGACGVQMGTRFLAAEECSVHPVYREKVLKATDLCTMVTGRRWAIPSAVCARPSPAVTVRRNTAVCPMRHWKTSPPARCIKRPGRGIRKTAVSSRGRSPRWFGKSAPPPKSSKMW